MDHAGLEEPGHRKQIFDQFKLPVIVTVFGMLLPPLQRLVLPLIQPSVSANALTAYLSTQGKTVIQIRLCLGPRWFHPLNLEHCTIGARGWRLVCKCKVSQDPVFSQLDARLKLVLLLSLAVSLFVQSGVLLSDEFGTSLRWARYLH